MKLDDIIVSRGIVAGYMEELLEYMDMDVAIGGGGPSGLTAGYYLAKAGFKVALFEKKLSMGGGMWGGGMMFNKIVVQEEGKRILDEMGIRSQEYEEGYYLADSIESVSTICSKACQAGLKVFNLMEIEDVMIKEEGVEGLVINWSPVEMAGLHVDPITIGARAVIDATGHPCEVVKVLENKMEVPLKTETGKIMGEKSMWADVAEQNIMGNVGEVYPGLYVTGMAANAVHGSPRMGPIFGGMLLSGEKVAEMLIEKLK
ncbi:MAG: sulfide-dependent adenosine diphosphate thiazole synthase [Methanobacterium sp.]|jgi:thiazole biosynthesis enzyme|uniref:sulfide-dependent adenosine diphosphate thiazole synthase n=1 Tax=Methanobacterium sp. TaxID=2164 RepID=UPI0003C9BC39|nr:sulfide-dependent adenosine diphosphate thiazole synthase [Methanobacterium sp.]MDI3550732.1 sulfide-dependent adenosine diphosphate thiazole synthase [Methanobacterium sp.]CDG65584.1 Ribose 1,5-bisphosphate isomerase [Methanobacterium sp. MB1]